MSPVVRRCSRHGTLVRGRCPACAADGDARGKTRRAANNVRLGRKTRHWERISKERLRLAGGLCEISLRGCTGKATTCDLIGGGDHSRALIEDTRAACLRCHGQADGARR